MTALTNLPVIAALLGGALLVAFTVWVYRTRELPVSGRGRLAALRSITFLVVLVLLLNPELPGSAGSSTWTVIDGSSSMSATLANGGTPGEAETPADETGARVVTSELPGEGPAGLVARAIESGASEVIFVSDMRLSDGVELRALLDRAPIDFRLSDVGGDVRNAGVEGLAFGDARSGESTAATASIFWESPTAEPLTVRLLSGGEVVAEETLIPSEARGRSEVRFEVMVPEDSGDFILTAEVGLAGDGFSLDDRRSQVLEVDPDRGAAVMVSWAPGWETRYLAATLTEVAGIPVRGFLKASPEGEDRYLRMGEAPELVDGAEVRRAVEDAAFVIRHGRGAPADSALERALADAPRRMTLPAGIGADAPSGEWYLAGDLPPSPLAAELAGITLLGLPPLALASDAEQASGSALTPLLVQRDGTGTAMPALVFQETQEGREVSTSATGFWRWALRPGEPATLYRRLWSGVAGWLLAGGGEVQSTAVLPIDFVSDPASVIEWEAAPAAQARLEVTWSSLDGEAVRTDTLSVDALGRAESSPLAEGQYRWTATVLDGDAEGRERTGLLVREAWSPDLSLPRDVLMESLEAEAGARRLAGSPLRGNPAPWLILLLLLSSEWFIRRRTGLR